MNEQKSAFRPPLVFVGYNVQWFRSRNEARQGLNPMAAIVTVVNGGKSIGCWAVPHGYNNGFAKDVCLHVDDPDVPAQHEQDPTKGFWREVPDPDNARDVQVIAAKEAQTGKRAAAENAVAGSITTESAAASVPSKTK